MPRGQKKSATTGLPNGALQTTFAVEPAQSDKNPPTRIRTTRRRGQAARKDKDTTQPEPSVPPPLPTPPAAPEALLPPQPEPSQPLVDDPENPFVEPRAEQRSRESQLPTAEPSQYDAGSDSSNEVEGGRNSLQARLQAVAIAQTAIPRAGRHSPQRHRTVPVQPPKKHYEAKDVRTYFKEVKGRQECHFCAKQKASGAEVEVKTFSLKTGTGVLRKHLCEHHTADWILACDALSIKITADGVQDEVRQFRESQGQQVPRPGAAKQPPIPPYSEDAFVDALVDWIVADDQSINVVESPHLIRVFRILRSTLREEDIPCRTTIRKCIMEYWDKHLELLEKELQASVGKISFTMDMWSDPNMVPFMAVTAHWLEAVPSENGGKPVLRLRADLIGFHRVPGNHTGEHLAEALIHITDRIGITDKFGWLTMDNASSNDTCVEGLESRLTDRGIQFSAINSRIRCFPHIINLVCQAMLDAITNMDLVAATDDELDRLNFSTNRDIIAIVRGIVRSVRASSLRRQYFAEIQQLPGMSAPKELIRDVKTRWSSTYLMIERALECKLAIIQFLRAHRELQQYTLAESEWRVLDKYMSLLQIPHAFQQLLSAEKTPTLCNAIPGFHGMLRSLEIFKAEHPRDAEVVDAGIRKIRDYIQRIEDVPAYTIAMAMNPAMKLEWHKKHRPHRLNLARDSFLDALRPYRQSAGVQTPARGLLHKNRVNRILGLDDLVDAPRARSLEAEVAAYLGEPLSQIEPLIYWQQVGIADRFPTLHALALDILPIQGSAVPCERVFSSGKETITARRNRMKPELMEALQMLKFSLKHGRSLHFTEGMKSEEEMKELEKLVKDAQRVPEDMPGFINNLLRELEDHSDNSDTDSD